MRRSSAAVACVVLIVAGLGRVAVADEFWPLYAGESFEYIRTDANGVSWSVRLDVIGQESLGSHVYWLLNEWNYNNDDANERMGAVRAEGNSLYNYNPSGPDYLEFQMAPVGTKWIEPEAHDEYNWKVCEITAIGSLTVPYGTFSEAYTRRTYLCVDPNDLGLGKSPDWYDITVPGVGFVKEIDYWCDSPPTIQELVNITPEPATAAVLAIGGLAALRRRAGRLRWKGF